MKVLVVDNYDSFTYNLVQYLQILGAQVLVFRNDEISIQGIVDRAPERILISPGPCDPEKAGVSLGVIENLGGQIPILGVCLGHQCIGKAFGGRVVRARVLMHGKTSAIAHDGLGVFRGLPNPLVGMRYHSLMVTEPSPELIVSATTQDAGSNEPTIMGLRHRTLPIEGVQFHPESILSDKGLALLRNFLDGASAA